VAGLGYRGLAFDGWGTPDPMVNHLLSRTSGAALAAGIGAIGMAFQRTKPLHPEGRLQRGTISRLGTHEPTGVPLLDDEGTIPAIVRLSRGVGLPEALPDFPGLAIRIDPDGKPADILLAGTGLGSVSRFVLVPRQSTKDGPLTTLLPYRSEGGPLMIGALPEGERSYQLQWSRGTGEWLTFARLDLGERIEDDLDVSFDPVVNLVPGLEQYPWVRMLREPAYRLARWRSDRSAKVPSQP